MTSNTPKGIPYPAPTDANNVPVDIKAVADWLDARPGIQTMTTAQRDALTGGNVWLGRIVFNSTTGRLEQNATGAAGAANWGPLTRPPEVWVRTAAGTSTWTKPTGATRVRVILVGGGGAGAPSATTSRGGGGGALLDATFPAGALPASAEIVVGAGGTSATAQAASTTMTWTGLAVTLLSYGGYGGDHSTWPGGGGTHHLVFPQTTVTTPPDLGGPGGTSAPPSAATGAVHGRGGGCGATKFDGHVAVFQPGPGSGRVWGPGDVRLGVAGAGGRNTGLPGDAPGGGGAGGDAGGPGAVGAACLISYFD